MTNSSEATRYGRHPSAVTVKSTQASTAQARMVAALGSYTCQMRHHTHRRQHSAHCCIRRLIRDSEGFCGRVCLRRGSVMQNT